MTNKSHIDWAEMEYYLRSHNIRFSDTHFKNPMAELSNSAKAGKLDDVSDDDYMRFIAAVRSQAKLWRGKSSVSADELIDNAIHFLPMEQAVSVIIDVYKAVLDDNEPAPLQCCNGIFDKPWVEAEIEHEVDAEKKNANTKVTEYIDGMTFGPVDLSDEFWGKFAEVVSRKTGVDKNHDRFKDIMGAAFVEAVNNYVKTIEDSDKSSDKDSDKKSKKNKK